ncbi:GSCFA domain-containing protein [Flavobacterium sp. 3HN19-14]|uniref:GSCFA domain-containing protein n=1 Tax=Flavobacterium sp. 3HN19-14 TaxID=3448133 RepID=UPI003EE0CC10
MQFRTQIPISRSSNPIGYDSKVVSLGSCFAVNIGEKFRYFKLQNVTNPFGILFHPIAIEKLIDFALSGKEFGADDIFFTTNYGIASMHIRKSVIRKRVASGKPQPYNPGSEATNNRIYSYCHYTWNGVDLS